MHAIPLIFPVFVVVWALLVSPYSNYGDNWAVFPVLLSLVFAILCHIYLIFKGEYKLLLFTYMLGHILFFTIVCIYCLMLISKDSL